MCHPNETESCATVTPIDLDNKTDTAIQEFFSEARQLVDARLRDYLNQESPRDTDLRRAMSHSLFAGGKRIRAAMMLAVCDMLAGPREAVLPAACAVEMIHTSSLIIDDLPCMDDASIRRGQPTSHCVFGEATAILAGFALLNLSFHLLSRDLAEEFSDARIAQRVIHEYASAIGAQGMIGGQFMELENRNQHISSSEVEEIHNKKTAYLFVAGIRSAAMILAASAAQLDALTEYARQTGFLFQVVDDLLDVTGSTDALGKDIQQDQEKTTFLSHHSVSETKRIIQILGTRAIGTLQIFGEEAHLLRQFVSYLTERQT